MKKIALMTTVSFLLILLSACEDAGNTDNLVGTSECNSTHEKVGYTGVLSTFAHNVSGQVEVIDDCTIEVTSFNYDGGGPAVYFYAGVNQNYDSNDAFAISTIITGMPYTNGTITLKVPAGKTLDDFDSISVWCVDFKANFGDTVLMAN